MPDLVRSCFPESGVSEKYRGIPEKKDISIERSYTDVPHHRIVSSHAVFKMLLQCHRMFRIEVGIMLQFSSPLAGRFQRVILKRL